MSKYTDDMVDHFDEEVCQPWHSAPELRGPIPVDGSDSHHMAMAVFKRGGTLVFHGFMEEGPNEPPTFEVNGAFGSATSVDPSVYPAAYEVLLDAWMNEDIYTPEVA